MLRLFSVGDEGVNEYAALMEWHWQDTAKGLGKDPFPVPLCPPHFPHELAWY